MPKILDAKMPTFIQAMYGVIIGIGSLQLNFDGINHGEKIFRFIFFAFTLLITAHDWYVFHSIPWKPVKNFWPYLEQIGSLFFLAQMVSCSSVIKIPEIKNPVTVDTVLSNKMALWYIYGILYTFCNIFNLKRLDIADDYKKPSIWFYVIHFSICIVSIISIVFVNKSWIPWTVLLITIALVVIIWIERDKILDKINTAAPTPDKGAFGIVFPPPPVGSIALAPVQLSNFPLTENAETQIAHLRILEFMESNESIAIEDVKKNYPDYESYIDTFFKTDYEPLKKEAISKLFSTKPE